MSDLNHIILNGNNTSLPYTTHNRGPNFNLREGRNIEGHGRNIRTSFNTAITEFTDGNDQFDRASIGHIVWILGVKPLHK